MTFLYLYGGPSHGALVVTTHNNPRRVVFNGEVYDYARWGGNYEVFAHSNDRPQSNPDLFPVARLAVDIDDQRLHDYRASGPLGFKPKKDEVLLDLGLIETWEPDDPSCYGLSLVGYIYLGHGLETFENWAVTYNHDIWTIIDHRGYRVLIYDSFETTDWVSAHEVTQH